METFRINHRASNLQVDAVMKSLSRIRTLVPLSKQMKACVMAVNELIIHFVVETLVIGVVFLYLRLVDMPRGH